MNVLQAISLVLVLGGPGERPGDAGSKPRPRGFIFHVHHQVGQKATYVFRSETVVQEVPGGRSSQEAAGEPQRIVSELTFETLNTSVTTKYTLVQYKILRWKQHLSTRDAKGQMQHQAFDTQTKPSPAEPETLTDLRSLVGLRFSVPVSTQTGVGELRMVPRTLITRSVAPKSKSKQDFEREQQAQMMAQQTLKRVLSVQFGWIPSIDEVRERHAVTRNDRVEVGPIRLSRTYEVKPIKRDGPCTTFAGALTLTGQVDMPTKEGDQGSKTVPLKVEGQKPGSFQATVDRRQGLITDVALEVPFRLTGPALDRAGSRLWPFSRRSSRAKTPTQQIINRVRLTKIDNAAEQVSRKPAGAKK